MKWLQQGAFIHRFSIWVLLASLITAALLTLAGRLLIENAEYFRSEIENELADYGIRGAVLENLRGSWRGFHPTIIVRGASLSIPGRAQALSVNELELSVKLIPSLISGDLMLRSLYAEIEKLILVRNPQGHWLLNDIPLAPADDSQRGVDFEGFFASLPDFVMMDIGLFQIRDQVSDQDYLIQNSVLQSSRDQQGLALRFNTRLPASLGQEVELLFTANDQVQKLHVRAEQLNLAQLEQLGSLSNRDLQSARLSMQSWIDLERYRITRVVNQARLSELSWNRNLSPVAAISADILQHGSLEQDRWRLHSRVSNLRQGTDEFPDLNLQLLWNPQQNNTSIWLERFDVAAMQPLIRNLLIGRDEFEWLENLQAEAKLTNFVADIDPQQPYHSLVSFGFEKLNTQPYQQIPGITDMSGQLLWQQGRGRLDIDAEATALSFNRLFRDPLEFDRLTATAFVNMTAQGLLIDTPSYALSNRDIELEGRMLMDAPKGGKPFMSLRARYENANAAATSRYLPVGIMPQKTVDWLDRSIRGGDVSDGQLLFHGRLQKLSELQRQRSGEFHALFDVSQPQVKFLPDWPEVKRGNGRVSFHNTAMLLDFSQVRFADTDIDQATIRIADLTRASLSIDTSTRSNAEDLLKTLSRMPILDVFDEVEKKQTAVSGQVSSELQIDIPLSRKIESRKTSVKGRAELSDLGLTIPEWLVDFKQTSGVLELENQNVTAEQLKTRYFDDEAVLSVTTDSKRQRTHFKLAGDLTTSKLLSSLPAYLHQPVSGKSPWKLDVSVAHSTDSGGELVEIKARSDLNGSLLDFPQPFYKAAAVTNPVRFQAKLNHQQDLSFFVDMKKSYQAQGLVSFDTSDNARLEVLDIEFTRASKAAVKNISGKTGIHLNGQINNINLLAWRDFIDAEVGEENIDAEESLKRLESVDLGIDTLSMGGLMASTVRLQMVNNGDKLKGSIQSSMMQGKFELPYKMGPETPLQAELDYLILAPQKTGEKIRPDINAMPNLKVNSKVFQVKDLIFNDLQLTTRCEPDRFVISQLDFLRDQVRLKSSGHWQYDPRSDEHVSVFNIDIRGSQFGQTVTNLGLGETIKDGKVEFNGQIGWGGELFSLNWPSLIGEVELKLDDGVLRNVEPGAGRFVGLLSLNALPRRLFLDFGDVVSQGTEFKRIKGKFIIEGEQIKTQDAYMDSTSARVRIEGSTNLREKTYDQSMYIIPKLGDTLPVIGTLAAGSSVGWGLLLLQQLFDKPIEKTVEIEYKVSGSWDDPRLTLMTKAEDLELDNFDNNP